MWRTCTHTHKQRPWSQRQGARNGRADGRWGGSVVSTMPFVASLGCIITCCAKGVHPERCAQYNVYNTPYLCTHTHTYITSKKRCATNSVLCVNLIRVHSNVLKSCELISSLPRWIVFVLVDRCYVTNKRCSADRYWYEKKFDKTTSDRVRRSDGWRRVQSVRAHRNHRHHRRQGQHLFVRTVNSFVWALENHTVAVPPSGRHTIVYRISLCCYLHGPHCTHKFIYIHNLHIAAQRFEKCVYIVNIEPIWLVVVTRLGATGAKFFNILCARGAVRTLYEHRKTSLTSERLVNLYVCIFMYGYTSR